MAASGESVIVADDRRDPAGGVMAVAPVDAAAGKRMGELAGALDAVIDKRAGGDCRPAYGIAPGKRGDAARDCVFGMDDRGPAIGGEVDRPAERVPALVERQAGLIVRVGINNPGSIAG